MSQHTHDNSAVCNKCDKENKWHLGYTGDVRTNEDVPNVSPT